MENNENEALEPADAQHEQCGSNPARALVAVNFRVVRDPDGIPICKAKLYCRTTDENEGNDFFPSGQFPFSKSRNHFEQKNVRLSVTYVSVPETE
jgi:hypothetical protein